MEHRQRRPCHAGTLPAGTVAPGSAPAPAARHRNGEQTPAAHDMHRDTPGAADRTASADRRPEQQRTTRRRPGLFLLPRLHAYGLPGLPDQQPGTRWALCRRCPDDHASTPQPQQIAPPAAPPAQRPQPASLARPHSASASRQQEGQARQRRTPAAACIAAA